MPLLSGPYTMYEWPVTQPTSAAHHQIVSSWMSKIHLCVTERAGSRLTCAAHPSASPSSPRCAGGRACPPRSCARHVSGSPSTRSCHQTSRPRSGHGIAGAAKNDEPLDGRRGLGGGVAFTLSGTFPPLRQPSSCVIRSFAPESRSRSASESRSRRRPYGARRCARTRASRWEAREPSPCRDRRDPPCGFRASATRSRAGTPRPAGRRR